MPLDRVCFDLRGPVQRATIVRWVAGETSRVEEHLEFREDARLMVRRTVFVSAKGTTYGRAVAIAFQEGGTSLEEEELPSADAWASRYVPNISFGCSGASVVRTQIDSSGVPTATTFYHAERQPTSRIEYRVDDRLRVIVARQILLGQLESDGSLSEIPAFELCAVRLSYDDQDRHLHQSASMLGQELCSYAWDYSADDSEVTVTRRSADGPIGPERYHCRGFDAYHNWTVRSGTVGSQRVETERRIDYFL